MTQAINPWLKFTHIALVVRDIEQAVAQYSALGLGPFTRFRLPSSDFPEVKMTRQFGRDASDNIYEIAWGKFGEIAMEIFQPIAGDSIAQRFLDAKGEGVWHYGYDVEDMDETVSWMMTRGYEIVGESETADGLRTCYFSTTDPGGVYFQAHEVPASSDLYDRLAGNSAAASGVAQGG